MAAGSPQGAGCYCDAMLLTEAKSSVNKELALIKLYIVLL